METANWRVFYALLLSLLKLCPDKRGKKRVYRRLSVEMTSNRVKSRKFQHNLVIIGEISIDIWRFFFSILRIEDGYKMQYERKIKSLSVIFRSDIKKEKLEMFQHDLVNIGEISTDIWRLFVHFMY